MKLVDILARELKVWPHPGNALGQAADTTLHLNEGASHGGKFYGWTKEKFTRAEDHHEAFVTRAQWQAAVDALKAEKVVEWGRGELPPVGTICEHAPGGSSDHWYQVEIIEHRRFNDAPYLCAVFATHNDVSFSSHESFRPIRTPEQIADDEKTRAVAEMEAQIAKWGLISDYNGMCQALYDAGYRKFEIVDN